MITDSNNIFCFVNLSIFFCDLISEDVLRTMEKR